MSDVPTSSVPNDFSKTVDYEESPPSYTGLYLIQSQPQLRVNHPATHGVLRVNNPELNNIQNYTSWSTLNILCCCWILGCVACYYSCKTDSFISKGNIQGALNASRSARTINIIATNFGIICFFIYLIYSFNLFI